MATTHSHASHRRHPSTHLRPIPAWVLRLPQFEEAHPDFVAGYHRARQIIDRGHNNPPAGPPATS